MSLKWICQRAILLQKLKSYKQQKALGQRRREALLMQGKLNTCLLSLAYQLAAQHQRPTELRKSCLSHSQTWGVRERRTLCLQCGEQGMWKTTGNGVGSESSQEINWEQMVTHLLFLGIPKPSRLCNLSCRAAGLGSAAQHSHMKEKSSSVPVTCTSVVSFPTKCQWLNASGSFLCVTCTGSFLLVFRHWK